ncbi:MAG: hypothetical protein L6Q65_07160 [Zoogloea sp.]|nr:hypothetical protein [Zoogloea sp.]
MHIRQHWKFFLAWVVGMNALPIVCFIALSARLVDHAASHGLFGFCLVVVGLWFLIPGALFGSVLGELVTHVSKVGVLPSSWLGLALDVLFWIAVPMAVAEMTIRSRRDSPPAPDDPPE